MSTKRPKRTISTGENSIVSVEKIPKTIKTEESVIPVEGQLKAIYPDFCGDFFDG